MAIKALTLRSMQDWRQLELFEREARALQGLRHEGIPRFVEYFEVDTASDRGFFLVQVGAWVACPSISYHGGLAVTAALSPACCAMSYIVWGAFGLPPGYFPPSCLSGQNHLSTTSPNSLCAFCPASLPPTHATRLIGLLLGRMSEVCLLAGLANISCTAVCLHPPHNPY